MLDSIQVKAFLPAPTLGFVIMSSARMAALAAAQPEKVYYKMHASPTKGYQVSLGWTQVWSPTLVAESNFGYLRDDPVFDPPTLGVATTAGATGGVRKRGATRTAASAAAASVPSMAGRRQR